MGCQDRRRLPLCSGGPRVPARADRLIAGQPRPAHGASFRQAATEQIALQLTCANDRPGGSKAWNRKVEVRPLLPPPA